MLTLIALIFGIVGSISGVTVALDQLRRSRAEIKLAKLKKIEDDKAKAVQDALDKRALLDRIKELEENDHS